MARFGLNLKMLCVKGRAARPPKAVTSLTGGTRLRPGGDAVPAGRLDGPASPLTKFFP